ncbi:MAG: hypothetical protein IKO19_05455 [Candidatus Riflebacteria bacterium]|nr:hypothetical protein [Candidatus Riflebacteria bacterium]
MPKRIVSFILCICLASQFCSAVTAAEAPSVDNEIVDSDILDLSSYVAASRHTVNDILNQYKFTISKTGHGFAAERGNNLADKIKGKNTWVVGDNNVKNGPDRLILERNGTKIWIQDKYYSTANAGIDACFDETSGMFRYLDGNGNPMQIEVPSDQWEAAVERMKLKIEEGKVPGITDPKEAETLVRKGALSYKQALNLAKAGTLESLTYDAANGAVTAGCAFGISAVVNYTVCRMNGEDHSEALKIAAIEGVKTGGLAFGSSVIASQLCKTELVNVFQPTSEALVNAFGKEFAEALLKSAGNNVLKAGGETTAEMITKNAARVLRSQTLVAVVTTVVFTVPDAIDVFRGRISKTQFVKNFAVTAVSVVAGTVGGVTGGAVGELLVPGVGVIPGAIVGSILFGAGGGWAADKISDYIVEDDAVKMYEILQNSFAQCCEDYLVNETEAQNIADKLNKKLKEDTFKDMYQSENRERFAERLLTPLFDKEVKLRDPIEAPTEEEMRTTLKDNLKGVVFVH